MVSTHLTPAPFSAGFAGQKGWGSGGLGTLETPQVATQDLLHESPSPAAPLPEAGGGEPVFVVAIPVRPVADGGLVCDRCFDRWHLGDRLGAAGRHHNASQTLKRDKAIEEVTNHDRRQDCPHRRATRLGRCGQQSRPTGYLNNVTTGQRFQRSLLGRSSQFILHRSLVRDGCEQSSQRRQHDAGQHAKRLRPHAVSLLRSAIQSTLSPSRTDCNVGLRSPTSGRHPDSLAWRCRSPVPAGHHPLRRLKAVPANTTTFPSFSPKTPPFRPVCLSKTGQSGTLAKNSSVVVFRQL